MAEHTPGPWEYTGLFVEGPDGKTVAGIALYMDGLSTDANGRLIAAAPDLLDACKEALHVLTPPRPRMDGLDRQRQRHREVIAKAEGKTL